MDILLILPFILIAWLVYEFYKIHTQKINKMLLDDNITDAFTNACRDIEQKPLNREHNFEYHVMVFHSSFSKRLGLDIDEVRKKYNKQLYLSLRDNFSSVSSKPLCMLSIIEAYDANCRGAIDPENAENFYVLMFGFLMEAYEGSNKLQPKACTGKKKSLSTYKFI